MIKYNSNTINDWNYDASNIVKVYRNNAIVFYKISGESPTPEWKVCFAVVDDISQYQETEFEDVFNNADGKWYKLNNLNQYEEYGVYGSGRTITTYEGKLTIDDGYEYEWNGSSWVNLGEVSGSTIPDNYVISFEDSNVKAICVNNWGGNVVAGELTYGEAKQVTSLGSVFKNNNSITSFNELAYFKGLTSLDNGEFARCTNLTDIVIPNNITTLGYDQADRCTFSGCTNLSGITMISGGESLTMNATANNGSYYMKLSHQTVPMVFPDRQMTLSNGAFGYYDYLTTVYFQSSTPPTNLANADISNYRKLANVYCPVGSLSAYEAALTGKGKTIREYDFETDSLALLDKEKEWVAKTSSQTEYPKYYTEKSDPLDGLTFNTLAEAQTYAYNNCVYDGMKATIDGDRYYFDSSDENGWVENESRLPQGYTEVEYIRQNSSYNAYIDTGVIPYGSVGNSFEVSATMKAYYRGTSCDTFLSCEDVNRQYFGFGYRFVCGGGSNYEIFGADNNTATTVTNNSDGTFTYVCSRSNVTTTYNMPISLFCSYSNSSYTTTYRFSDIEVHSMSITLNNEVVRNYVPAKRDSDNKYGLYDLVTDTFYVSPNGNNFVGGPNVN